jgi:hypothetical protein
VERSKVEEERRGGDIGDENVERKRGNGERKDEKRLE